VKILVNTPQLQAISTATEVIAVFYGPGTFKADGIPISSDKPCMLIFEKRKGKIAGVWASNPDHKTGSVELNIGGVKQMMDMPDGDLAGSSIHVML
jgi:hypothetical protein